MRWPSGASTLPGADGPKYKNSPETLIYTKSKVLYGLNWSKQDIVTAGEAVVCEGYTDVIGLAKVLRLAVATCGPLHRGPRAHPGSGSPTRSCWPSTPTPPAKRRLSGVYEWERRHDLQKVAEMPTGWTRPDLATQDPERLRKSIAGAAPLMEFRVGRCWPALTCPVPGPRSGSGTGGSRHQRASERPGSRPVPDAGRGPLPSGCRVARFACAGAWRAAARGARQRRPPDRDTPETTALALLVHRPAEVRDGLHQEGCSPTRWTRRPTERSVLRVPARGAGDGRSEAADLIQRLAVDETEAEAEDVLQRLVGRRPGGRSGDWRRWRATRTSSWTSATVVAAGRADAGRTAERGHLASRQNRLQGGSHPLRESA